MTTRRPQASLAMTLVLTPAGFLAEHAPSHVDVPDAVRYDVTFNSETAADRLIRVAMTFSVESPGEVALSIPAWTPGSYELDNHARHVRSFEARGEGAEIRWDKADFDTWRVYPTAGGTVTVEFDYLANELDTGMAWATLDFVFYNGTNIFPYFEGEDLAFRSTVTFHTEPDWAVATGLTRGEGPREYRADTYHELVDMPTMVGRLEADSRVIDGRTYHLATYPADAVSPNSRQVIWDQIERMLPPMSDVWGETPWDEYTTLMVFDPTFPGGSALEHSNSHLGVYANVFIGSTVLASITAHEIFHAWNVKRLRPADLWPYDYGRAQPTELLWISEGVTDYYADLALVRGRIVSAEGFYQLTMGKIQTVDGTVPVALEDASLTAWISPDDGTSSIYYPKGSLAGFALDVLIRDASDNRASLDDVMRRLYEETYSVDEGFTEDQWWSAVSAVAPGLDLQAFHDAYVDGRTPFAWEEILPRAGLRLAADTVSAPRIGITTQSDSAGVVVVGVVPDGAGGDAGVEVGDLLVRVGDVPADDASYAVRFRRRYGGEPSGTPLPVEVLRDGQTRTLTMELRFADNISFSLRELTDASEKAARIRDGILDGRVDP